MVEEVHLARDQLPKAETDGDIIFKGYTLTPTELPPGWEVDSRGRIRATNGSWLLNLIRALVTSSTPAGVEPGSEGKRSPGLWVAWQATGTMVAGDVTFASAEMPAPATGERWEVIILAWNNQSSTALWSLSAGEGTAGNPTAGTPDLTSTPLGLAQGVAGAMETVGERALWFVTKTTLLPPRFRAQRGAATDAIRLSGIARKVIV